MRGKRNLNWGPWERDKTDKKKVVWATAASWVEQCVTKQKLFDVEGTPIRGGGLKTVTKEHGTD